MHVSCQLSVTDAVMGGEVISREMCTDGQSRRKDRKLRRLQHTLLRQLQLSEDAFTDGSPSLIIAICNAGFSTGLREKDLMLTFGSFGAIDKVLLLPGKSFCFVAFLEMNSATQAYDNLYGTTQLTQHGQTLYLAYLSSLPSIADDENSAIPEGLKLFENFISPEEEEMLLSCIDWNTSESENSLKNRKVKHYGYEFLYGTNNIDLKNPLEEYIPPQCTFLWDRLKSFGFPVDCPPDQLTVNQYDPGQGIPSHVDTHSAFLNPLISLSLGSSIVMEFRRSNEHYKLSLPRQSILILNDSSRYDWFHGIVPRTYDVIDGKIHERQQRTSFTFRWVRPNGICDCVFPTHCDTAKSKHTGLIDHASLIEKQHVHQVYDEIASHFDDTRIKIWPCVEKFVQILPMGSLLVDIGCGNGKNLHIRNDIEQIGIEYSKALAEIAAWKKIFENNAEEAVNDNIISLKQVVQGNCLYLPLRSGCADAAISIAVFHHLANEERRRSAICELIRILRPGGVALISVWARDQSRFDLKTSYLKQDRKNRKSNVSLNEFSSPNCVETLKDENGLPINVSLPVHKNRTQFLHQDLLVPWKLKNSKELTPENQEKSNFMRFYHVFEEGELKNLCETIEGVSVESSFYEQGNWCVIIKKLV
ncbi:tRNA (carboxymethyluridine(34)-5-O)-methyltransferase alkbh8 [Arctopsyche grandis]|uniref:tRNA (carboxymethyluridine(34)-5-O)-methyltransferase alkbh8 n=1 Tax=Arctopsyche grandis TaxID=121162 RepID=UPI00406D8468